MPASSPCRRSSLHSWPARVRRASAAARWLCSGSPAGSANDDATGFASALLSGLPTSSFTTEVLYSGSGSGGHLPCNACAYACASFCKLSTGFAGFSADSSAFFFPQRAAAAFFPRPLDACAYACACSRSRSMRACTHFPSAISKYLAIAGRVRAQFSASSPATRASTVSSSGSAPDVQLSISNSRYAPCCSVVSRRVSAR